MRRLVILTTLFALLITGRIAGAQEELVLSLSRNFGYGGGSKIQGTFTLKVKDVPDLERVEFLIDGEVASVDEETPFRYQFNTSLYDVGVHKMMALGYLADGTVLESRVITKEFINASTAFDSVQDFIVPLLIIIGVVAVLGVGLPALTGKKKKHVPGVYGLAGGAICPRCAFPYARSVLAPNLLVGKLQRCPHCGKWAIVAASSASNLAVAEELLAGSVGDIAAEPVNEEDALRKMLDDSQYEE